MEGLIEKELIIKELLTPLYSELTSDSSESLSSVSFSSDEEHSRRKRIRIKEYVERVVRNYSDYEFKFHFRMGRSAVYKTIDLLKDSLYIPSHKDGRDKISSEKAFLMTLWYLSNQETFRQVSDRFNVTLSSAHRCLRRVLGFLLSIKSAIIKWPTNVEAEIITEAFRRKQGVEGVVGAIDGSHIEISKPTDEQLAYINRKGYHSLLLQVIVDHNKRFLDVYCGEPGSMHDARLLRKSNIYEKIHNNPDFIGDKFIIGDTAYPNLHWLVTPFKDNGQLTVRHNEFNYKLSATRVVVEHALGLLKGRFRRLRKLDNLDKNLCSKIIMAACVLHDIYLNEEDFIDMDLIDFNQPAQMPHLNNVHINLDGEINRQQQLFNYIYNI